MADRRAAALAAILTAVVAAGCDPKPRPGPAPVPKPSPSSGLGPAVPHPDAPGLSDG